METRRPDRPLIHASSAITWTQDVDRLANLVAWLADTAPDIVCLQELKAPDEKFPAAAIRAAGYGAVWHGQKSWNSVAILVRGGEPAAGRRGLPGDRTTRTARRSGPRWPVEIPAPVKERLRLDADRSWVVLSEWNEFIWPGPDVRRAPGRRAGAASAIVTRQGGDGSPAKGKREPAPRALRVERGPPPVQAGGGRRPALNENAPPEPSLF